MTIEQLSQYTINEVLNDQRLLIAFKTLYKDKHGTIPTCSACAIANEFRSLLEAQNSIKIDKMEYKYKSPKGDILTFLNENGKRVRCYDTNLNIDFVQGFLTANAHTTQEVIEERKLLFKQLPSDIKEEIQDAEVANMQPIENNTEAKPVTKKRASRKKK